MSNEASMAEMNMAMNSGRYAKDDSLHVEFYYKARVDPGLSEEAGHPVHKDVLYARVTPPGGNTVDQPVDELTRKRFAKRIEQFEALQDKQQGVEGFRIEEWPAITRAQAEDLRYHKIFTVEQLAETSDGNLQTMMGGYSLKQKAKDYLDEHNGMAAQLAKMAARIEELEADNKPKPRRRAKPDLEMESED